MPTTTKQNGNSRKGFASMSRERLIAVSRKGGMSKRKRVRE